MDVINASIRYAPAIGGAEEYIQRIAEGLVRRGHTIKVYTSDLADHIRLAKLKTCGKETINGVRVNRSYTLPFHLRRYSVMPALPFKLMRGKADLIHTHAMMTFPSDIGALISKIKKKPFVFSPYFADLGRPSLMGRVYRKTVGKAAMAADAVICVSDYEKDIIRKNGFETKRVEVVFPGVDLKEFERKDSNIFEKYDLSGNKVILFAGRLEPIKGVDVLLRAMPTILKKIPETKLFIAGPDFGQKSKLEHLAGQLKIADKVIFAGRLSREELISAFLNADVFCFPSRFEAFGIVMAEAMAAKTPVVVSNCSAMPYLVKNRFNGLLFEPENHRELASHVLTLFEDNGLRQSLINNGYDLVSGKYSWKNAVDKTEWIYSTLIN